MEAEAEGLRKKAEAWNTYGKAAQLNLSLEAIKAVAQAGADSIGQIKFEKVIALDSGSNGGDSAVNRMMTAAPSGIVKFIEQMKAATGINLAELLKESQSIKDEPAESIQSFAEKEEIVNDKPNKPKK